MPEISVLISFLVAVIAIQLLPGPDMMLVIARGIGQGRRVALTCVAGISAASLVQIPALAFGVAALFETSALAYNALKYIGAIYLVYLGVRFILTSSNLEESVDPVEYSARAAFFQGFWNNLANPKSLVFLLAFLPQFVDPDRGSITTQLVVLGIVHKAVGFCVDSGVALVSGTAGNWLRRRQAFVKWQERFVGCVLVTLGVRLAFDSRS